MIRRPPRSTRTDTLFPYTTLFRSHDEIGRIDGNCSVLRRLDCYRPGRIHIIGEQASVRAFGNRPANVDGLGFRANYCAFTAATINASHFDAHDCRVSACPEDGATDQGDIVYGLINQLDDGAAIDIRRAAAKGLRLIDVPGAVVILGVKKIEK